jgi:hypothetical protein
MTERPEDAESSEAAPRKQPTDATDTAEPIEPMERIDPIEPMERIESVEFTDQRALPTECSELDMTSLCPPRSGLTRGAATGYERRSRQH